jgi:hypothetical protein
MSESIASEVISAMIGGIFSASALYPLEVLKTRMQAETKVSPPSSSSSKGKGTGKEKNTTTISDDESSSEDDDGGGGTTTTNKRELYALAASKGMRSYASLMYENEGGILPFYTGVLTSAIQSATEKALYFFAYTFYKNG